MSLTGGGHKPNKKTGKRSTFNASKKGFAGMFGYSRSHISNMCQKLVAAGWFQVANGGAPNDYYCYEYHVLNHDEWVNPRKEKVPNLERCYPAAKVAPRRKKGDKEPKLPITRLWPTEINDKCLRSWRRRYKCNTQTLVNAYVHFIAHNTIADGEAKIQFEVYLFRYVDEHRQSD